MLLLYDLLYLLDRRLLLLARLILRRLRLLRLLLCRLRLLQNNFRDIFFPLLSITELLLKCEFWVGSSNLSLCSEEMALFLRFLGLIARRLRRILFDRDVILRDFIRRLLTPEPYLDGERGDLYIDLSSLVLSPLLAIAD